MALSTDPLISWTPKGLFCEAGGFYIDPHRGVDLAIVTHAHSDHARRGSKLYICEESGQDLLRARLGDSIRVRAEPYGKKFQLGDVTVSLHSAGHILGSAQVRVEYRGEVWVASGDYKRELDPSCEPFEIVPCETFITEATFGTPKYVWEKSSAHGKDISDWWEKNAANDYNSVLFGYSLGKAQRILAELAPHATRPVFIHPTMTELTECYRKQGRRLAPTRELKLDGEYQLRGELILAPPSIFRDGIAQKLGKYRTAFASGWMSGAGSFHSAQKYDEGFVISDHADWNDLNRTIKDTGAQRVFVQHRDGALVRHLRKLGIAAHSVDALAPVEYSRLSAVNLRLL